MKKILGIALLAAANVAMGDPCPNQQLACRIATASSTLSGNARGANHPYLANAASRLWDVANDFCRCYFGRYPAGSGVLMSEYQNVEYVYGVIEARGDMTHVEQNSMQNLRRVIGR